jgi:hypothetical protein
MTTNINVKLKGDNNNRTGGGQPQLAPGPASYPSQGPIYPNINDVNFIPQPLSPRGINQPMVATPAGFGEGNGTTNMAPSQYQYPVNRGPPMQMPQIQERAIDLEAEENKDAKIRVLEALLEAYEGSPIVIKGFLTLHHKKLIEIIQILTEADKVELMTEEGEGCGCGGSKFAMISKIFVLGQNGKRGEFKVNYNEEYSLLIRHGVNLKLCRV